MYFEENWRCWWFSWLKTKTEEQGGGRWFNIEGSILGARMPASSVKSYRK